MILRRKNEETITTTTTPTITTIRKVWRMGTVQCMLFVMVVGMNLQLITSFHVGSRRHSSSSSSVFVRLLQNIRSSSSSSRRRSSSRLFSSTKKEIRSQQQSQSSNEDDNQKDEKTWIRDSVEQFEPAVIGPKHVLVYDTTLRDGTQGESVSATCDDKLKITKRLIQFDMDYIEGGWPGSNPKDAEFFHRAKSELTSEQRKKLAAFGSTRRKNVDVAKDSQVQALIDSEAPSLCLVCKSHSWQVEEILKTTKEENLYMIEDTVRYLIGPPYNRRVFVDLEHFFDGYKSDPEYAIRCAERATDAGATCLVLCDTNGGTMPWEVADITKRVVRHFGKLVTVGIHAHNDCGMAVANSLSAVQAGAGMVQGTINGIGERTGNADLCAIVPSLALHMGTSQMTCQSNLQDITKLSRYVDEILNLTPNNAQPYVGTSAFAHKGGLHVSAMERSPLSYQHIHPELVGNEKRILVSELSGRQNIMGAIESAAPLLEMYNISLPSMQRKEDTKTVAGQQQQQQQQTQERAMAILNRVKELENQGYTFEGAEASVHLMILHSTKGYCPPFRVLDYSAHVYDHDMDSASRVFTLNDNNQDDNTNNNNHSNGATARATVKVRTLNPNPDDDDSSDVNNPSGSGYNIQDQLEVSDGNGPVDALAKALTRALRPSYPSISNVELVDYKVRILDPKSATGAATRVMIEFRDKEKEMKWTTVSVDRNVISASLNALTDGFEYALIDSVSADQCILFD